MNHSGKFLTSRRAGEVFELVADSRRFSPLLPDFESMTVEDATHFTLRIRINIGQINGHANLAMEMYAADRPNRVEYRGTGIVAGSQLNFAMQFQLASAGTGTQVNWQGEVSLEGMLAQMAGGMMESMGRGNFEAMAERLRDRLCQDAAMNQDIPPDPGPAS
jgi:carbon monoxide dehydrogenase subunit G